MVRRIKSVKILFIVSLILFVAVMTTIFILSKQKDDQSRIKGVFVISERGDSIC